MKRYSCNHPREELEQPIFFVYFHINPIKQEVFYVGMGGIDRAYDMKGRSKWWKDVIKKYGYEVFIVATNLTWKEAGALEVHYIAQIGRSKLKQGPLINMTPGGDGVGKGSVPWNKGKTNVYTIEQKKRISAGVKKSHLNDPTIPIRAGSHGKGKKCPKHSEFMKGRIPANKGVKMSEEQKKKISESTKKAMLELPQEKKDNIKKGQYKKDNPWRQR
jgi:hypothetical protein